jgi:hypothetical protein
MRLCPYKHALGEPGKGVHSVRFAGLAVFDILGTIGGGYALAKLTGKSVYEMTLIFFFTGIILHRAFCVETTLDRVLFDY